MFEKGKGTTQCDKRIFIRDVGTAQCKDGTVKCEKKKVREPSNVRKKLSHVMLELHNVRMEPSNVRKKLSHVMLELYNVRMELSSVRKK